MARVVVPGVPHHVTQRGNNRQDVFFCDDDRLAYLRMLAAECRRHLVEVHGLCLMTNHVHVVATPATAPSLAQAIGRAHWKYAQYINRMHGRSGHLWQGRFYSAALDEAHFWTTLAYVERNPVRAAMVDRPWDYPWSSAAAHVGSPGTPGASPRDARDAKSPSGAAARARPHGPSAATAPPSGAATVPADPVAALLDLSQWERWTATVDWKAVLLRPDDHERVRALRRCTSRGRPLGSESFLHRLETRLKMRLRPLRIGRPRGAAKPPAPARPRGAGPRQGAEYSSGASGPSGAPSATHTSSSTAHMARKANE